MKRRTFLSSAAAGLLILPTGHRLGAAAPSNKLNIALIGVQGRGIAHIGGLQSENVVALCDIDETHLDIASEIFPKAERYVDWRKCLDHPGLDAVVCCTPDHTHGFIGSWALNRGLHTYMEKPLGNTVAEARLVRGKYLSMRDKVCTQVGTQRHANPNFNRLVELVRGGAIGELQEASAWGNRQLRREGYWPAAGEPPAHLHYDLWLGPSPYHPYNPEYFAGPDGVNCLHWNMFWDFGTGQVGDMGSHTYDLVWNVVDGKYATSAEGVGEEFNPEVTPVELHTTFENPANDWRPAIKTHWYQGGMMPESPREYIDLSKIGHGAMFKGSKGYIISDFNSRIILPNNEDGDFSYYDAPTEDEVTPDIGNFQQEWINACKGDLKTSCDFDYSGLLIEQMLLGLVAYRAGEKIEYDGEAGKVTNNPEADALLGREYREGWTLEG